MTTINCVECGVEFDNTVVEFYIDLCPSCHDDLRPDNGDVDNGDNDLPNCTDGSEFISRDEMHDEGWRIAHTIKTACSGCGQEIEVVYNGIGREFICSDCDGCVAYLNTEWH